MRGDFYLDSGGVAGGNNSLIAINFYLPIANFGKFALPHNLQIWYKVALRLPLVTF